MNVVYLFSVNQMGLLLTLIDDIIYSLLAVFQISTKLDSKRAGQDARLRGLLKAWSRLSLTFDDWRSSTLSLFASVVVSVDTGELSGDKLSSSGIDSVVKVLVDALFGIGSDCFGANNCSNVETNLSWGSLHATHTLRPLS